MQFLEEPHVLSGISRNVDDANLLSGQYSPRAAVLGDFVGDPDFSVREEQDSPFLRRSALTPAPRTCLALTVSEHVSADPCGLRIDLRQLVQTKEGVTVGRRHAFQAIVRGPPLADVPANPAAAPDRTCHVEGSRLAGAGGTA